jgi:hypothetical protein
MMSGEETVPLEKFNDTIRNKGFPDMCHIDSDTQGPPVAQNQQQTFYREYEANTQNDIK